jgi:hypothetical protein
MHYLVNLLVKAQKLIILVILINVFSSNSLFKFLILFSIIKKKFQDLVLDKVMIYNNVLNLKMIIFIYHYLEIVYKIF